MAGSKRRTHKRGEIPRTQCHTRSLHVHGPQPQADLLLVDHRPSAGVDAEVLERPLKVWHFRCRLRPCPCPCPCPCRLARQEPQLLAHRQHPPAQRRDVVAERCGRHGHQLLRQSHAHVPLLVLLLEHAAAGPVVAAVVRAHHVGQLIRGAASLRSSVRQQHGGAAHPEEAVRDRHRAAATDVPVMRDVLGADHHRIRLTVYLNFHI
ncbi:hypothetical protein ZIOFF_051141 [Zingiber officinale]|uniref:Uncharacterized protein n=1 Tax=Zingiber officinale TaxID=94328 RepID=A0A8J5FS35_ZINOF|nr:hypothetical protein ZIOFF_051141 [Zingiber officinale]